MELFMSIVSILAGVLTTSSFLPQAVKTIKTKDTRGISLIMYIVFTTGVFCWLIYGIYLQNISITISNLITFVLACIILTLKIKYK